MTQERDLQLPDRPPVIDYEDSGYKTDFWVGQGREYEDTVERLALARLMPPRGLRIAEIGAGFGRLADQYVGYEQIVLFDYSRTLLVDAARHWGHDSRFVFVAGNVYDLPLADGVLDTLVMVRVMHHLADVPAALAQLRRALHGRSVAVIEYANKRNLKAMLRWMTRRQAWSPLDPQPVEFVELNFDFHPDWMSDQLAASGLSGIEQYGVSHFRLPLVKNRVGPDTLARLDASIFGIGGKYPLAPSVFVQLQAPYAGQRSDASTASDAVAGLFRCPVAGTASFEQVDEDLIRSADSGLAYARRNGVWDFKEPVR